MRHKGINRIARSTYRPEPERTSRYSVGGYGLVERVSG